MNDRLNNSLYILLWLGSGTIIAFLSYTYLPATFVDGSFIPAGNDAFYHARRIIDAAVSERGFYQFDDTIHVPEGSWLTWPWGYDYLMALALRVGLMINPAMEPMKFLAFVPMFWAFVNAGLFTLIARQLRIPVGLAAVAAFAYSITGVVVFLHAVGNIDHHFIELTFVLATVLTALRFFREGSRPIDAVLLGIVLGMAPAFHNILFILQVPVVATFGILWLRREHIDERQTLYFAAALFATCFLFLLPSATFREFFFEYATHSWFHLYIAFGTAAVVVALSRFPFNPRNLALIAGGSAVLLVPLALPIVKGFLYVQGEQVQLDIIQEVAGPLAMYLQNGNSLDVTRYYSWMILLAPVLVAVFAWRLATRRDAEQIYLAAAAVFGLGLLMMQYRLHPFGSWALLLCPIVLLDEVARQKHIRVAFLAVPALAIVAIAYQPTLRHQLFKIPQAGMAEYYESSRWLYPRLAQECEKDPGVVLSYTDEGHHVRYHTECTVIANNFLLTEQHGQKVLEVRRLLNMTPEEFLAADHDVKYIFLRLFGLWVETDSGREPRDPADITLMNAQLFIHLIGREETPPGFELLKHLELDDEREITYAAVYKVDRAAAEAAALEAEATDAEAPEAELPDDEARD